MFDVVFEVHFGVALYGEVVHIHKAFVLLGLRVSVTHFEVGVGAGGDVFAEEVGLDGCVDDEVVVPVEEGVGDAIFWQSEVSEIFLFVADGGVSVGEDVVDFVLVGLEANEVYFFALFFLSCDEAVNEVPSFGVGNGEDEAYCFDVFPVVDTFVARSGEKAAELPLLVFFYYVINYHHCEL